MTPELKPCPFCGAGAEFHDVGDFHAAYYVACTQCVADMGSYRTEAEAAIDWNRRADLCQPKVKPLVWRNEFGCVHTAWVVDGSRYKIDAGKWTNGKVLLTTPDGGPLWPETLEAAKAAAEAHYTAWALDLHKQLFEVTE